MHAHADTPMAPEQLVAAANEGSIFVSWSPPSTPSHLVWYYSVQVFDMNELHAANTSGQMLSLDLGIDTCNRSYHIVISVCGVNAAGKGAAVNTTLIIQQNIQLCPTVIGKN